MSKKENLFAHFKSDFASGLVVFLVALPLCLGIAMASGAPLFSGIISGIIGGIVVGYLSQSQLSVTGPAAGLTAIILTAISDLGSFDIFLSAVFLAGLMQLLLGFLKAGGISNYFPTNVIEGMLAGIGIIIVIKQIPLALGLPEGKDFFEENGDNLLNAFGHIFNHIQLGSVIITLISMAILIAWDKIDFLKQFKLIPGALVAVLTGIILNEIFINTGSSLVVSKEFLVALPVPTSFEDFKGMIVTPNFTGFLNPKVWIIAITITIVASIETLLCIEAADQLDPHKRCTNTDIELKAQGVGNMISALLGGLPMTSVVVRTSANVNAGAKTKLSAIIHGVLLLVSVLAIPFLLNKIPLSTLAGILILVGYKLAKPSTFMHFWKQGKYQFLPFLFTFVAVVTTDLLKGVALGIVVSILFILRGNLKRAYSFRKEQYHDGDIIHIDLAQEVSFLNKASIRFTLNDIPENSKVVINASDTVYIAHDVLDLINEFVTIKAIEQNIKVKLKGFKKAYDLENSIETQNYVTVETHYDAARRKMIKKEISKENFPE
jgi:MFS superfamily sulfate permease-like transporter